jgi:homoserine acetyltransferase
MSDSEAPACGISKDAQEGKKVVRKKGAFISSLPSFHAYLPSLAVGLAKQNHPTLVIGVQSDTLFPIEQQRELAECLKANGNDKVVYYELNQPYGHDTFLLDVNNVGGAVKGFLEKN